jgi:hypothetical protein
MKHRKKYMVCRLILLFPMMGFLFLSGCAAPKAPVVVKEKDIMLYLEPGLRPETVLFPEYLFLEGLELDQHGRIPETLWVGAELKTEADLKPVLRQYNKVLATMGWQVTKAEIAKQSFRLMASKKAEMVEIRAVQGSGSTQVFILYQPGEGSSAEH